MSLTQNKYFEKSRAAYYQQLIFPAGFQNFIEITRNNHESIFKSELPVRFKTLEFGDTEKEVTEKLGMPGFKCVENGFSPMAYYYREELLNHSLIFQVHFFDNKFVLATHSILDPDLKWRGFVKKGVIEKYGGTDPVHLIEKSDTTSVVFSDTDGHKIFILESINLNIVYFSGNPRHRQLIEDFTRLKIKKMTDELETLKTLLDESLLT